MSDFDQTILSEKGASGFNQTPGQEPKKRNPLLIIGGIGCALLLCIALLAGGGAAYFLMQGDNAIADLLGGGQETVTVVVEMPTSELAEPTSTPTTAPTDEGAQAASETEEAVASDSTPTAEEETPAVSSTITQTAARALRRAGIDAPFFGAHLFRHSAATTLLRQGASLETVGEVLRHASLETTVIYAKVDRDLLQQVALPWPEVTPC